MGTYASYKTNQELEKDGIELDLGEAGLFKIARAGGSNQKYLKRVQALSKPYRRAIQAGSIDQKDSDRIVITAFAEHVVLGWERVTGPDGQPLPYTTENAIQLFTDLPDLFQTIQESANDASLFRQEVQVADSEN